MEKDLIRMDEELERLKKDYELVEQGKVVPLKSI
jgi:hypothetical protein